MIPLIRRQQATEATIARYDGKPFVWGSRDCVRVASWHVRKLGCRVSILKGRRYHNALTAKRTLKALGFSSIAEGVDALGYARIPLAMALVGDIVAIPGDGDVALTIAVGNGRVLGAMEDRWGVMQPQQWEAAWRVL
jgi:hypothetical protein